MNKQHERVAAVALLSRFSEDIAPIDIVHYQNCCFLSPTVQFIATCKILGGHALVDQKRHI
jgi:hypothetical protein